MTTEEQKDLAVSDALVTIENCIILGQNYMENQEVDSNFTPLYTVFDKIQEAVDKLKPYYN